MKDIKPSEYESKEQYVEDMQFYGCFTKEYAQNEWHKYKKSLKMEPTKEDNPNFHHIDHIIKKAFIAGRSKQSWKSFRKENGIDNIRDAVSNLRDHYLDMINEIETAGPEVEKLEINIKEHDAKIAELDFELNKFRTALTIYQERGKAEILRLKSELDKVKKRNAELEDLLS